MPHLDPPHADAPPLTTLPTSHPHHNAAVTIIEPPRGLVALELAELWRYRELLFFLVWRDIKVRYKQTLLGATWAIIQPLFSMLVFSLFFGTLAGIRAPDGLPYWLFAYTGLVPWVFFANGLSQASDSLLQNANLIRKVYFPRLAVPIASVLSGLVDFALAFTMLLIAMLIQGFLPSLRVVLLPLFLLLAMTTALGVGLWLSALNVQFRDVRYVIPFLSQIWLFATPIAYPSTLITDPFWQAIYGLNPMVGVIEGFRWALLGANTAPGPMLAVSVAAALTILVSGAFYFRRTERTFADIV